MLVVTLLLVYEHVSVDYSQNLVELFKLPTFLSEFELANFLFDL